jgi:hypothetical protein
MNDIRGLIDEGLAVKHTIALKEYFDLKREDSTRYKRSKSEQLKYRPSFSSQSRRSGTEFHPVLRLKGVSLDQWTSSRCVQPDRCFEKKTKPLRMQYQGSEFGEAPVVGKEFLKYLEKLEKSRLAQFLKETKPVKFNLDSLQSLCETRKPFTTAVSKIPGEFQFKYPYEKYFENMAIN